MYIQDARERLDQTRNTIVDLCLEMREIDDFETRSGRDFLKAPAYIPKAERLKALEAESISLLRVIEGD